MSRTAVRWLVYLWAAPTSCVGLLVGCCGLLTGGGVQLREGVLEFHGGLVAFLLRRGTPVGATAMALGHTVLARHISGLEATRGHERVHVRQAEVWGPAFIPAYFAASLVALLQGGHFYLDNGFERAARRESQTPDEC